MPKPLRIILICAAITGFLLLVWWAFTHRSEVKEGEVNKRQVKQEKAEVEKNKEKEPVTGKRQVKMTRICLSMDVNNSENGQFLHGTPRGRRPAPVSHCLPEKCQFHASSPGQSTLQTI